MVGRMAWAAIVCGLSLCASENLPVVPATPDAIRLDGSLNEAAWARALTLKVEHPAKPGSSAPPATLKALMKDYHLYFAFVCPESGAPRIAPEESSAIHKVLNSDYVAISMSAGRYGLFHYYMVHVAPDGAVNATASGHTAGQTFWTHEALSRLPLQPRAAAKIQTGKEWTVEVAFDLEQFLRYPQDGVPQILAFNFSRVRWGDFKQKAENHWMGYVDHFEGDKHFQRMSVWHPYDFKTVRQTDEKFHFHTPVKVHWNSLGHLRLEAGSLKNELRPPTPEPREYRGQPYAFTAPRMEHLDDIRPKAFPVSKARLMQPSDPAPAEQPAFAVKPQVTQNGAKANIAFKASEYTDVAVAIVDGQGRVVRHLAAGMLGENAPAPLKAGTLAQELEWDFCGDDGQAVPNGTYKVRVSLGMTPTPVRDYALGKEAKTPKSFQHLDVENLPHPKIDGKSISDLDHQAMPYNTLAIDRARGELYLPGQVVFDYRTGKQVRDLEMRRQLIGLAREGEVAVGYDGHLYVDGHNEIFRFDHQGKPQPFAAVGRNVLPYFYGGHSNPHRGLCSGGPEGDVYIIHGYIPHGNPYTQVSQIGADGRIRNYGIVEMPTTACGIKADRQGNIYVGCTIRPMNQELPPELERLPKSIKEVYRYQYGSIVKFGPQGGYAAFQEEKYSEAFREDPRYRYEEVAQQTHETEWGATKYGNGNAGLLPIHLTGAEWVLPGYSPMVNRVGRPGPRCACHTIRFELDDFNRLFVPDGIQGFVRVVDARGNTIAKIGARTEGPIRFRFPEMVVADHEYCFVSDYVLGKNVQIKLDYRQTEEAAVTK